MRKIINGKMYNTDTAKMIYMHTNGLLPNDFNNLTEVLYRKKTEEFFLHGWGGAKTKYREQCYDGWCGGEEIVPLTEAEAKEWLERYGDVNTYIDTFGEPEE